MTLPGLAGERFIAAGQFMWMNEFAAVLKARLGDRAKRVPTMKPCPTSSSRLIGPFDPKSASSCPSSAASASATPPMPRTVLGWVPRPAEESIVDTARSLLAAGLVKGLHGVRRRASPAAP